MSYEAWRISYQSSEQAARAAWEESMRLNLELQKRDKCSYMGPMRDCPTHGESKDAARYRWRPEVVAFADAMEAKLRDNDEKGGWQDCAPHWLMMRMIGEAIELLEELDPETKATAQFYAASRMLSSACEELNQFSPHLKTKGNPKRVLSEAVDVANFAMMVADVIAGSTVANKRMAKGRSA